MPEENLPTDDEFGPETEKALDRIFNGLFQTNKIFRGLFQGIRTINQGSLEADEEVRDSLIKQAKKELLSILEQNGIEVIKFNEDGLILAIPVAYIANRPESVVRLLIYRRAPFGELQIKIQGRIHCTADNEHDEDEYNWYRGKDCFSFPLPTSRNLATGERERGLRAMQFNISNISNGRFSENDLRSKVSPEDLVKRLRIALYIFEKYIST